MLSRLDTASSPLLALFASFSVCHADGVGWVFFSLLWGIRAPGIRCGICCLHPSGSGLGVPGIEIHRRALHVVLLDRVCVRSSDGGQFWSEDACRSFPSLRRAHLCEEWRWLRAVCSFCRECRVVLVLSLGFLRCPGVVSWSIMPHLGWGSIHSGWFW